MKAAELEKLSLVGRELLNKSVSAGVADGPSPAKRQRPAGDDDTPLDAKVVEKFLMDFASIPLDSLAVDEAMKRVVALVQAGGDALASAVGLPAGGAGV